MNFPARSLFDNVETISADATAMFQRLRFLDIEERVDALNAIRLALKEYSPFKDEPVDCVLWVKNGDVVANDYNPNSVAPPEMALLEHSIQEDGYTQPIVAWKVEDGYEVIDGFHRHRVGKESKIIQSRIHGYLPLAVIRSDRADRNDRIASTIRHNRARGKHGVQSMSDIVIELKKRNWSDTRIGKELGMDEDEILRLCQISGLSEVFADEDFSEAWEAALFIDDVPDEDVELEESDG
jgi:ParB-like chromosome segregation protein Spo0J